jgi:hypothetical protein
MSELRNANSGLFDDVLTQLSVLFGQPLLDVYGANRRIEAFTGVADKIGRNNLLEAFSHLGVLFAEAPLLDRDQQMAQMTLISDHLRRALMEAFEQEVTKALAEMWDTQSAGVGARYNATVPDLVAAGKLLGHVHPDGVTRRRDEISTKILDARRAKLADGDWSTWKAASTDLEWAADELQKLRREMGTAVDAAAALYESLVREKRERSRFYIALILGFIAAFAAGVAAALLTPVLF